MLLSRRPGGHQGCPLHSWGSCFQVAIEYPLWLSGGWNERRPLWGKPGSCQDKNKLRLSSRQRVNIILCRYVTFAGFHSVLGSRVSSGLRPKRLPFAHRCITVMSSSMRRMVFQCQEACRGWTCNTVAFFSEWMWRRPQRGSMLGGKFNGHKTNP